ncbi:Phosphate transport regulator related to PhoU [uncultured Eubacteriales bacterium]|uniref:Phosphate transport regulator related to PhoU n=1 Tax=uncultured Eubacteriales bacterium TaxID=172733 RepID=A0A212KER1_9FIRM|nr:Phosphate transport regulator related to PhoU [uncultured Eubacteriales bacterium]
MSKKNSPYFDDFIAMAEFSCQAAEYLHKVMTDYRPDTLDQRREEMHQIEHTADAAKHSMMARLNKEFVTPIDREDIIQLANELDNVTDKIDDILIRMYMYNIKAVRPAAIAFTDVIVRCCRALQLAITEFPNFQRSNTLIPAIINVNTAEEEGDSLYMDAVRDLYQSVSNPIEVTAWSELFDRLEDCCDACEHVADSMEIIVLKNS